MKVFLIILVIALIAVIWYLINRKTKTVTIVKPRPNSSWTNAEWLKNGYTQKEIDDYKKGNAIVQDVLSQLNF